jgi:predicted DNA-binding transcriptional regulator AlpA
MVEKIQIPRIIIGVDGLSKVLGVSKPTIYQYMAAGMPGRKINGRWHYHMMQIDNWFKEQCSSSADLESENDLDEQNERP